MSDIEAPILPSIEKKEVLYCSVCSVPPEYCEFGVSVENCKTWLFEEHPELYKTFYKDAPINVIDSTVAPNSRAIRKATEKQKVEAAKKGKARITVKRIERNKRKCITSIFGLELFDVELKKAAKLFANKFACGSSVTKNNQGQDEIVVQGDISDDLLDFIPATWPSIDEDKIDLVEDKKNKKSGDAEGAPSTGKGKK